MNELLLTQQQLRNICNKHKYILLRTSEGKILAINTKISELSIKEHGFIPNRLTDFVSYKPCDFQTYISLKNPFVRKK